MPEKEESYQLKESKLKENLTRIYLNQNISVNILSLENYLDDIQKNIIIRALVICNGNKKNTAKLLGFCYKTLLQKIKKYQIEVEKKPYFQNLLRNS